MDGADPVRTVTGPAELLAQAPDVLGHCLGVLPFRRRSPDLVEQLVATEDLTGSRSEVREQVELAMGEIDACIADLDLPASAVDEEIAETEAAFRG